MTRHPVTALLFLLLALLAATGARADHEIDHRYSIHGYLVDGQDRPIAGALVSARLAGERASGRSDGAGYYVLDMHLHDHDIGQEIELRAGEATGTIRMRAEAGNQHTTRVHWASFVDGKLREDDLGRFRVPGWGWVVIGLTGTALLLAGAVKLQNATLRRRRAKERAADPQRHATKKGKARKKRR